MHFNGALTINDDRREDERRTLYELVLGYDFRIGPTLLGIIDVVREQDFTEDEVFNYGEIGLRFLLHPLVTLSVSGGGGANDDGEAIARGTVAVQLLPF